jgi:hypothetical protein
MTALVFLVAYGLAMLGSFLVASSMRAHRQAILAQFLAGKLRTETGRALGFCLLLASLAACLAATGAGFASLAWLLILQAAVMSVALTLAFTSVARDPAGPDRPA